MADTVKLVLCRGCGTRLPVVEANPDARYETSAECFRTYGRLTVYSIAHKSPDFLHQHVVDTYGAQHVSDEAPALLPAFALIGLHLWLDRGYTGKQVKETHARLARTKRDWPRFETPHREWTMTMLDPLEAPEGPERDAVIEAWARSVWAVWEPRHADIAALVDEVLAALPSS